MKLTNKQLNYLFIGTMVFCFMPFVSPAIALGIGILFSALGFKNADVSKYSSLFLKGSVVLMGFGMQLPDVLEASKDGLLGTAVSVILVMSLGFVLTRLLKVDTKVGLLIASGTAICGGSAIAAIAPLTNSKNEQISFSLAVVFILNAIALVLFPLVGHALNMDEYTFGKWAAIAIHDTSSVVGAGAIYGETALQIATTVKLIRALWIIPLSLVVMFFSRGQETGKIQFPWFILLFVGAIIFSYFVPTLNGIYPSFAWLGKKGMVVALFLIGSSISLKSAKQAGLKSFIMGIGLWIFISVGSLIFLMQ